ncbi:6-phosphogluconolactonase [Microtus ochrogaster]|uniref:6-phosphogluconolactonase n=1 Tax=Microtus ochrogaster TaxID=79684 RepID=A0A8J6GDN3_MICOH|nr:6-phosphogluconolactonase [Microtus ochrogaster]
MAESAPGLISVFSSPQELGASLAQLVAQRAASCLEGNRGRFALGLSGGSLVSMLARDLPAAVAPAGPDSFARWTLGFCDERLVPFEHAESTYGLYRVSAAGTRTARLRRPSRATRSRRRPLRKCGLRGPPRATSSRLRLPRKCPGAASTPTRGLRVALGLAECAVTFTQAWPEGSPPARIFQRAASRLWGLAGRGCWCAHPASGVQGVLGLSFLISNMSSLGSDGYLAPYRTHLLSKLPIPDSQVLTVNPALPVEDAAEDYAGKLRQAFQGDTVPVFDLLILGVGPDGHTCSLFPGHPLLQEQEKIVAPISDSPKPPPQRVTLTLPVLNAAQSIIFVATGEGKAAVLKRILEDKDSSLPATMVQPRTGALCWFLDEAAARLLSVPFEKHSTL